MRQASAFIGVTLWAGAVFPAAAAPLALAEVGHALQRRSRRGRLRRSPPRHAACSRIIPARRRCAACSSTASASRTTAFRSVQDLRLTVSQPNRREPKSSSDDPAAAVWREAGSRRRYAARSVRRVAQLLGAAGRGARRHESVGALRLPARRRDYRVAEGHLYESRASNRTCASISRPPSTAALERCSPMPFTKGMAGAIAGRPIAIRFIDDRTS